MLEAFKLFGWMTGFEPATSGTTNQRSNQLSYNHHFNDCKCITKSFILQRKKVENYIKSLKVLTAKYLSTVNPSAYSVPMIRPKSCALYFTLSRKFLVAIGVSGSFVLGL